MKTAVRRVLLMSALMSPGALYALGLGEIRLNSALNQPFDAEIELVSATQDDLGALRATLASTDTFTRYGLDRPAYLSDFNFRVSKGPSGKDVLRVTSPRPVTEPFVTLLVEANWPRGRLLREYTVLLDPPVFTPAAGPTEAVAPARVSSGAVTSARAAEPVAQAAAPAVAAPAAPSAPAPAAPRVATANTAPELAPGSTYRVRPNDTLYRIASQLNPGTRSDVNRAMVSIYQNNPAAFEGNINVLRSGSTLRLPDANQLQAVSAAAASAEVKRQYDAWRNGASTQVATDAGSDAGRLRLVTPEQGTAAPSTAVAPATASATTAAAAPVSANAAPADIAARVQQLEAELAEARRLLEVRNAELATLQGGAAPVDSAQTPAGAAAPADAAAASAPAATPEAPKAETPKKPEVKRPDAEPPAPSLLERVQEYWWALLGLLAAGLGVVLFQRLRRERGTAEESLEEALGHSDLRTAPRYTPRGRESDSFVVEEKRPVEPARTVPVMDVATAATRPVEAASSRKTVADTLSGDSLGSTESSDPLAEADFHMAYGLYDQAADLVQLAIKREPQRRDLRVKLLEIFFVWGNRDRFLDQARELHATRGDAPAGEWDKVLIMGKQIAPEESMFAGTPSGSDMLDMELHGAAATLDLDVTELRQAHITPDMNLTEQDAAATDATGLDFIFDDEPLANTGDSQLAPTIETPRVHAEASAGDTQELTVDNLGLDVDALRELEALDADDTVATPFVGDTVETRAARPVAQGLLDETQDLLSSTSLLASLDDSATLIEPDLIDLSETTGEVAQLADTSTTGITRRIFDTGEPPTMSEVGTKLDLARAYMDMGDPEGARSILDEVLQEGNVVQKQEAGRLIASLP